MELCRRKPGWLGLSSLPCQLEKCRNMGGAAVQLRSSAELSRSCVAKLPLRYLKRGQMTSQFQPRAQLPALQLLPFFWSVFAMPNGVHGGGCLAGAESTGVADTVLVHVPGITSWGAAMCHAVPTGLSPSRGTKCVPC